eukprot:664897_1
MGSACVTNERKSTGSDAKCIELKEDGLDATEVTPIARGRGQSKSMKVAVGMISTKFPDLTHISTDDFAAKLNENDGNTNIIILDVRQEKEYNISHLKNAINVSPNTSASDIMGSIKVDMNHENTEIYCYCSLGYRSGIVAQKLQKHGIQNVYNVSGSIIKWVNEGKPIFDNDNNKVDKVHAYNKFFALLVDDANKIVC